jgi:DNA-binding response OmpR family regulator
VRDRRRLRILVVEDEALVGFMVADAVRDLGHRPLGPARTVAEALAILDAHGSDGIDGALLDVNLDGEMATPVAVRLRDAGIPFAVASGYSAADIAPLGLPAPLLRKPFRRRDLARWIDGLAGTGKGA